MQFADIFRMYVHGCLDNRTLTGQDHNLVVGIIESRTDAPGVANAEGLPASGQPADHVTAVPLRGATFQDIRQIHIRLDCVCNIHARQSLGLVFLIQTFYLAIQAVSHLLEHDKGVGIGARVLTNSCYLFENMLNVGKIEITAKSEVLGSPVVAA